MDTDSAERCPIGHAVGAGTAFCGTCGRAVEPPTGKPGAPVGRRRWVLLATAALLAVGVAGVAVWQVTGDDDAAEAGVVGSREDSVIFGAYTSDILRFSLPGIGPLNAAEAKGITAQELCPDNFGRRLLRFSLHNLNGKDLVQELQSDMLLVAHYCPDAYAAYVEDADSFDAAGLEGNVQFEPGSTLDQKMRDQGWPAAPPRLRVVSTPVPTPTAVPTPEPAATTQCHPDSRQTPESATKCLMASYRAGDRGAARNYAGDEAITSLFATAWESVEQRFIGCEETGADLYDGNVECKYVYGGGELWFRLQAGASIGAKVITSNYYGE